MIYLCRNQSADLQCLFERYRIQAIDFQSLHQWNISLHVKFFLRKVLIVISALLKLMIILMSVPLFVDFQHFIILEFM